MSVRKKKVLEFSTNLNKWKGGTDSSYSFDGLNESKRDAWSAFFVFGKPHCSKRDKPQTSRKTHWIFARHVGLGNVNRHICSLYF